MNNNIIIETILYTVFGIMAVAINIGAFYCLGFFLENIILINTVAFILSTLFAYWTNSKFVFRSTQTYQGLSKFVFVRIMVLIIDNIGMILLTRLKIDKFLAKIFMNCVCIFINYLCSKLVVFKNK